MATGKLVAHSKRATFYNNVNMGKWIIIFFKVRYQHSKQVWWVNMPEFDTFNTEQNLDVFCSKIFAGDEKQVPLWKVVKMVVILSHGNVAVESGFSVNRELLVENMEEDMIVAQRIVFDATRVVGMDVTKIDISKKMIDVSSSPILHTRVLNN